MSSETDDGAATPDDGAGARSGEATADAPGPTDSSRAALVRALHVRRYARLAVAFGAVFAVVVAVFFLVVVAGGRTDYPLPTYVALGFTIFVTTAMLALAVLVGRRVLHLAVHPARIVRRAATGGLLAGILWLAAAVALALGPGQPWSALVDVATPWGALLTPLGLWALYTRYKRTTVLRPVAAVAGLAAVGGALVVADLAALDLLSLLGDVGEPIDPGTARLFAAGALLLVGATAFVALLAAVGDGPDATLIAVGVAPTLGLAGYLTLGPGRSALVALAAGLGVGWTVAAWRLRGVDEADVPTGPEPDLSVGAASGSGTDVE